MCVYKMNYVKVGTKMNYTIKRIDKNKAIMEMENGSRITLIFRDEDNPDIEISGRIKNVQVKAFAKSAYVI